MVFSSLTFLYFFLPLNLLLYYISGNLLYRNILLTLFSFVFYAWGEPFWILLLLFTAIFDYGNGIWIEKLKNRNNSKYIVLFSVIINLGLLIAFKYSGFLYDNISYFISLPFDRPENTLPIGISFYTFQTISYVIDVHRGEVKAQRNPINFLLFVSLYHQLVAGPIVRYKTIASEIDGRSFCWSDFSNGISRFSLGLFKKVIIANNAAIFVDRYLIDQLHIITGQEAWFGIVMFSVQIYFDFSGYSDMAIGLGKMFGFHYDENFKNPYAAKSITDFWRRWHISLGSFFRDYVYIPLGGNRKNVYLNLIIVWGLTGFWHGASWNYMLWGLYFCLLLIIEKIFLLKLYDRMPRFVRHFTTLFFIIWGWALFYFEDLSKLALFTSKLFYFSEPESLTFHSDLIQNLFWFIIVIIMCIPWNEITFISRKYDSISQKSVVVGLQIIIQLIVLIVCSSYLLGNSYNPFLYFRF